LLVVGLLERKLVREAGVLAVADCDALALAGRALRVEIQELAPRRPMRPCSV